MILGDISRLTDALLSVIALVTIATLGAVWRIGSVLGQMHATQNDHDGRLERLEREQDAHDAWHLNRGDR